MALQKSYDPKRSEAEIQRWWEASGVYRFDPDDITRPVFSIDTPPATVSGHLHLGHVYSYSHADFIARFRRMRGDNVYYPMGFDDNGLPTERLIERWEGIRARDVGREAFIERCLAVSERAEEEYRALWQRMGLSIDWRYTYRTIDTNARRESQLSFIDLARRGLAYRQDAPAIWCPACGTALAQADLNDLERESVFYTIAFRHAGGSILPIATTRPELLPACVAVFVHPADARYRGLAGTQVQTPVFGQWVPVLEDAGVDRGKGTGVVMCCTFGDAADVDWWRRYDLPLRVALDRQGRMTELGGTLAGMPAGQARKALVEKISAEGLVLGQTAIAQTVRVHERCDTPTELIITPQWFIRVLEYKQELLQAGAQVTWHPDYMEARFREWVEGLSWDWCISRQRVYGVSIPAWTCDACGEVMLADEAELPVDPATRPPAHPCRCGSTSFSPETDVMDTWATSALSPQIAGQRLLNPALYARVYPFSLRPQAHEIIRTWAFYTIVKSHHHWGAVPWKHAGISGWGIAPEGGAKISKSRGGGPMAPMEMMDRFSVDAVRYWAASAGFGKDAVISEEKIQVGARLITKLWNVARFAERFIAEPPQIAPGAAAFTPADRWILARTQDVIGRVTELMEGYDYAAAKNETESYFWRDVADNYLEMAKQRLYGDGGADASGARYTVRKVLMTLTKLFSPFIPYVTEAIYRALFAEDEGTASVHLSAWPVVDESWLDSEALTRGETLIEIATAARRYKSEQGMSLGAELASIRVATPDASLAGWLRAAEADLRSITRAQEIAIVHGEESGVEVCA